MASSKTNGLEVNAWARAPQAGTGWQKFLKSIYNPEEKSFLGRTAKRWGIVLIFYTVFYAVLALLTALCMGGLFLSIDDRRPTYLLTKSLIGANPGVAFRPLPLTGLVVTYNRANSSHYQQYLKQLEEFLRPYASEGWPHCSANDNYGFPDQPCFYIKLNKIYEWQPECFDKSSVPADMPADLVQLINTFSNDSKVWISCEEEKTNATTLQYVWTRGMPSLNYPYRNQPGYRSPLVAVKILNVPVNQLTTIRCRAWAKNIIYNKSLKDPSGYTRIQLLIEDKTTE